MFARALHAHRRHGRVFAERLHDDIAQIGFIVAAAGETAYGERIHESAQDRDRFFQVFGAIFVHDRTDAVLQFPRAGAGFENDRVSAAAQHDCFERSARAERWIEEDHPENFVLQVLPMRLGFPRFRGRDDAIDHLDPEISDAGGVFHLKERIAFARASIASSLTFSGGMSLTTAESELPPTRMPADSRCFFNGAAESTRNPKSKPAPRISCTHVPSSARRMFASASIARSSNDSSSITRSVARSAAHASGEPPNVLPRSPGFSCAAIASLIKTAPIGTPEAMPFAEVRRSGAMPY